MGAEQDVPDVDAIREAIEGEIVLAPQARGGSRRGAPKGRILDADLIKEVVRERLIKQRSQVSIAEEYGISPATVARWADNYRATAPKAANVVKIRDELSEEFDTIAAETWALHKAAVEAHHGEIQLKALGRLESIVRAKALLHGANAPVRHDLTVAVVTEAERELQEMIREAKAAESAREAEVIRSASEDAEL